MSKIRLQVFLSRNGICSRREAMNVVKSGRVTVKGEKVLEPSFSIDPQSDKVCVDGREVKTQENTYVVFNKPRGYVTTKASFSRQKNIYKILPEEYRLLVPVGRLDKDTEGVLLLTNDGDLTFALTHPKYHVPKTYYVLIRGHLNNQDKNKLEQGVVLDGTKTAPCSIKGIEHSGKDTELMITIHEGKKRQIRIMFDLAGHKVKRLKRLMQGPLHLKNLSVGQTRLVNKDELKELMRIKEQIKKEV